MVPEVIQTATKVLAGQLAPQEAVTILATMTREAIGDAERLRAAEPGKAEQYGDVLLSIGRELRAQERTSADPTHLKAVNDDLVAVYRALTG